MKTATRQILYVTISIFLVLAITPGTAWAASCSPDNNCVSCDDKSKKLKCKFDRMTNSGKTLMESMEAIPGLLTPAQSHGMGKAKERMDREKGRVKADDFKIMGRKRSAKCQLMEFSGDGDGFCDSKTELCAEVMGDSIGDDDGICLPMNGKKREACVQICDEEAILVDASAMDENSAAEMEVIYDTMTGHVDEVNATVPETAAMIQMLSNGVATGDPCVLQTTLQRHSYDTYKKARWAAVGSRAAADFAERFCDQVAGGLFAFSVGAACVAAESVVMAMTTWWEVVNNIETALDAMTLDATITCAALAASGVNQSGVMIQSVQNTLDDVRETNAEILRLMKKPPGQRQGYPAP